jgi:hypothetical protein
MTRRPVKRSALPRATLMELLRSRRLPRHASPIVHHFAVYGLVALQEARQMRNHERRLTGERRSDRDRRSGVDTRSEQERLSIGERRAEGKDRRSRAERRSSAAAPATSHKASI